MRSALAHRLAARADRLAATAALAAATHIVAVRHCLPPERVGRRLTPAETVRCAHVARGLKAGDEPAIAKARHEAIYLAVTVFGCGHRSIARVAGVSHKAVAKACARVEDRREDQGVDRALDELQLELMGSV